MMIYTHADKIGTRTEARSPLAFQSLGAKLAEDKIFHFTHQGPLHLSAYIFWD